MRQNHSKETIILYTRGEDIFCMISHIVGGAMGIAAVALCVTVAALHHNTYGIITGALFGGMMIVYYCMSSIYHGLKPRLTAKKVFRVLTQCAMFLLTASTYSTLALCTLRERNVIFGWIYFGILWAIAVAGILFNSLALEKFKIVSLVLFLVSWWSAAVITPFIYSELRAAGICLLLGGALLYTAGVIFYMLDQKHNGLHSFSHLFLLAGSLCQGLCVLLFVM